MISAFHVKCSKSFNPILRYAFYLCFQIVSSIYQLPGAWELGKGRRGLLEGSRTGQEQPSAEEALVECAHCLRNQVSYWSN